MEDDAMGASVRSLLRGRAMVGAHRVLVVDDEPDARELLATCLEARGCEVTMAADGEEALDVLRGDGDVGLVITDIMMPRLDGLALCDRMRAEPRLRSIPVVLVSALFGRGQHDVAQHPVVGALGKPIDLDALLALVGEAIGGVRREPVARR